MPARPIRPPSRPTGNFCGIPRDFIDRVLPTVPPAAATIWLVIFRRTVDWFDSPEFSYLSRNKLATLTGLSPSTVARSIDTLMSAGLIQNHSQCPGTSGCYSVVLGNPGQIDTGLGSNPGQIDTGNLRQIDTGSTDSVLIEGFEELFSEEPSSEERDDGSAKVVELELDRPIDKWAEQQAHERNLKLRITTSKQREALKAADSADTRQKIIALFDREAGKGNSRVRDALLRLVGFSNQNRSGMPRQSLGASHARSYAPATNQTKVDTALQETPLAQEIRDCRSAADLTPRIGDFINMPAWKVAVLDALRLRDKSGFRQRLTETFTNLADDYRQGVTTDAIVESFFAAEQQRAKQSKGGFDDIREYIASLSA